MKLSIRTLGPLCLGLTALGAVSVTPTASEPVDDGWLTDLSEATWQAAGAGKPILLTFR